jgi:cytochrome c peroxidase
MTHEERLQMYAQQHADKWNEETPYSQMPPEDMTDEAKVTCKAAAEAIREFHQVLYPGGSTGDTEQYLIDNGYVPQPDQEAANNG